MDSQEKINLIMTELVEKEIHQIEDNLVKLPTEFDMDPSLDENTKKALSKVLSNNADVFTTSDDDLKYGTTLIKVHSNTDGHKPMALKPYRIPLAHVKQLDEQIDKLLKA